MLPEPEDGVNRVAKRELWSWNEHVYGAVVRVRTMIPLEVMKLRPQVLRVWKGP